MIVWMGKVLIEGIRMTEPVLIIPDDMKLIRIETTDQPQEFYGRLLGVVDNERHGRPRWAEIELYRYVDTDPAHISDNPDLNTYGGQMYLLHTMGHSVLYHRHEGDCNKGIAIAAEDFPNRAEFPRDLEPCEECEPDNWKAGPATTIFDLEVIRHTIKKFRNAEAVLDGLRRRYKIVCDQCNGAGSFPPFTRQLCDRCHGRREIEGPPLLTAPGIRLVEQVKWKDREIREAIQKPVRL
jgi:hypothetical protein